MEATHERNTCEIQLEKSEVKIRHKMILHIAEQSTPKQCSFGVD
jgi:hypothetical protein